MCKNLKTIEFKSCIPASFEKGACSKYQKLFVLINIPFCENLMRFRA